MLDAGGAITQETRGWDEGSETTYTMRAKEDSHDYRYFPEPDLPPLDIEPAWLAAIVAGLPELPGTRRARYVSELGLTEYDASVLVAEPRAAALFEAARAAQQGLDAKLLANWVSGEYLRVAKEGAADPDPVQFAALVAAVASKEINGEDHGREIGNVRRLRKDEDLSRIDRAANCEVDRLRRADRDHDLGRRVIAHTRSLKDLVGNRGAQLRRAVV